MQRLHPADPNRAAPLQQGVHHVRSPQRPRPLLHRRVRAYAGTTSIFVGGEAGFIDQPVASTLTGEQVRQEFQAFRRNPVLNDGTTVYVGGEQGYVDRPVSHTTREAVRKELQNRHAALATPFQAR
jgi:hypothetical protein